MELIFNKGGETRPNNRYESGDFATARCKITRASGQNVYDTLQAENLLHDSIFAYQTLSNDTTWLNLGAADDTTYQRFYYFCMNENIGNFATVDKALAGADSSSITLSAAYTLNENLTPLNATDSAKKDLNKVYLDKLIYEKDTVHGVGVTYLYDTSQISKLNAIAYQNPATTGDAVLQAKVLLWKDVSVSDMQDKRLIHKPNPKQIAKQRNYNIMPNPNNGVMQLNYSLADSETGMLKIFDLLGKEISSYKLAQGSTLLNINETQLNNGVYLYKVIVNDKMVKSDKLVIVK